MSKKNPVKKPAASPSKPVGSPQRNTFGMLEQYLERNQSRLLLLLPLLVGAFFAALTFDVKISEGNDDAMYIEAATKYAADFTGYYYTSNAPMYPMLLGIVTMFTGFNLTLFKLLNTILFLAHLALMYYAFRRRIPYTVLLPVLLLSSVNSYLLYFSSQTYTEMLFLCLQAFFFLMFFKWQEKLAVTGSGNWKTLYNNVLPPANFKGDAFQRLNWALLIGFSLFLLTFCKNIAIGMLGALIVFFTVTRNWRSMVDAIGGYLVVRLSFEGIKAMIWGASNQYGSQGAILLQKDAYNPAKGQEDLNGFINRFLENFNLYTSKRIFQVLGFKDPDSSEVHTILSLLVVALLIFAAWRIYRDITATSAYSAGKSKAAVQDSTTLHPQGHVFAKNALLVLIYIATMHFLTYLVLQTRWDQPRLIMVYVPLLVMVVLYGIYSYFKPATGPGQSTAGSGTGGLAVYLFIVVLVVGSSLLTTVKKSIANYPVLKKNLQGDKYYGYTPDWENFLRLSEWVADSLPPNAYVASRKAPMSFVYGKGRPFYPVYTVPAVDTLTNLSNADSVLALFRENKVTHVLLGSLRRNPKKADGYIINTLHRMLQPVAQKYPQKVKLVKQIGASEPAYLYEVSQ